MPRAGGPESPGLLGWVSFVEKRGTHLRLRGSRVVLGDRRRHVVVVPGDLVEPDWTRDELLRNSETEILSVPKKNLRLQDETLPEEERGQNEILPRGIRSTQKESAI